MTGVDPVSNHAFPPKPSQHPAEGLGSDATSTGVSKSTSPSESGKRPANRSSASDQPAKKRPRGISDVFDDSANSQTSEDDPTSRPETKHQLDLAAHACRYLQETFSTSPLHSHATIGLVDRNHLQLYHENRSVILVSSAINFSGGNGLNKFIAAAIASDCLSFKRHGI